MSPPRPMSHHRPMSSCLLPIPDFCPRLLCPPRLLVTPQTPSPPWTLSCAILVPLTVSCQAAPSHAPTFIPLTCLCTLPSCSHQSPPYCCPFPHIFSSGSQAIIPFRLLSPSRPLLHAYGPTQAVVHPWLLSSCPLTLPSQVLGPRILSHPSTCPGSISGSWLLCPPWLLYPPMYYSACPIIFPLHLFQSLYTGYR